MMRPKLYYLSITSFAQVDKSILHCLSKNYDVTYGIIIPSKDYNFSAAELQAYCEKLHLNFEPFFFNKRQRDLGIVVEFMKVLQSIKRCNPQIIYSVSFDHPLLSLMSLTIGRKKTVIFLHDVKFHSAYRFSKFLAVGRNMVLKYFRYFQVFSENQEAVFMERHPQKKLFTIKLPLSDFGDPFEARVSKTTVTSNIRLLFFGNILPYKGLYKLITAANNLSTRYTNFELIIAGRCENWKDQYEPLVKNKPHITKLIRHIANSEIPEIFSRAHFLMLPYNDATQSGPLMIAYNYNIPVIASNIQAFRESVIEGKTGYFFDNTIDGLEKTLEMVFRLTQEEYDSLKLKLLNHVESNFSEFEISKQYRHMFSHVMRQS